MGFNLKSENVKLFPYGNERPDDDCQIFNEKNIINLIKHIVDKDSFIIKYDSENNFTIDFVINGYYFNVVLGQDHDRKNLWAGITVENGLLSGGDTFSYEYQEASNYSSRETYYILNEASQEYEQANTDSGFETGIKYFIRIKKYDTFTGLTFFTDRTQEESALTHTLQLFDANGDIYKPSFLKFKSQSMDIDTIQCSL